MQTIYINHHNEATLICDHCGHWKTCDLSAYLGQSKRLKVKCRCGSAFNVMAERRAAYRKPTLLQGRYVVAQTGSYGKAIYVTDVSQHGIRLRANAVYGVNRNDTLELTFTLDNDARTEVQKTLSVKYVDKGFIGAEFDSQDYGYRKEIGFYLMQSNSAQNVSRETVRDQSDQMVATPAQLYQPA